MKIFILYDGRAKFGDEDDATVMCTADSEEEAWEDSETFEDIDAIWFEADLIDEGGKYPVAKNHKPRADIGKGILL